MAVKKGRHGPSCNGYHVAMPNPMLAGVRVIEVAIFAPDAVGMHLADLGAEVIKVEAPGLGDPARLIGKPYRGE